MGAPNGMNAITETQAEFFGRHRARGERPDETGCDVEAAYVIGPALSAPNADPAPYPQVSQIEAGAKTIRNSGWGNAMSVGEMRALVAAIWIAMEGSKK